MNRPLMESQNKLAQKLKIFFFFKSADDVHLFKKVSKESMRTTASEPDLSGGKYVGGDP